MKNIVLTLSVMFISLSSFAGNEEDPYVHPYAVAYDRFFELRKIIKNEISTKTANKIKNKENKDREAVYQYFNNKGRPDITEILKEADSIYHKCFLGHNIAFQGSVFGYDHMIRITDTTIKYPPVRNPIDDKRHFDLDRISEDNKGRFLYIPIYDRKTDVIISIITLSAGIDGKMDNKSLENLKLYSDNWHDVIKFYNKKSIIKQKKELGYPKSKELWSICKDDYFWFEYRESFSISDMILGSKDLVVCIGRDSRLIYPKPTKVIKFCLVIE